MRAADLRAAGADHPYVPLLVTVPGIAWVLGYTIAAEIGDIGRFASAKKLVGYTGLCPFVRQSGRRDDRGPLAKNGPKYLRWALIEAATHAARHPAYPRPLRAHQEAPRPPARQQGRPGRDRPRARDRHLAHAHQERAVRPGRPRTRSGRLTTLI